MNTIAGITCALWLAALVAAPALGDDMVSKNTNVVDATLNGLRVSIDADTGSILRMEYPGPGVMLDSGVTRASAIDLAYPVKTMEALRAASRYSHGARVTKTDNAVVIYWDKVGLSRSKFDTFGNVSATVRLVAAEDGKSVVMSCEVVNNSSNAVRQVAFPDLAGLKPFAGIGDTLFRCAGFATAPFRDLQLNEGTMSMQYMIDPACQSAQYKAGGLFHPMMLRWLDLGSLAGGISLYPKRWGWDPQVDVRLQLSEIDSTLRMLCLHDVNLKQGDKWQSGEFVLTPHTGGWAKGIEPYRAWAMQHYKREYPVPKHVREGLGYRTTWMCQTQPADPQDAIFTFKDLPKLAAECKENGLDEMVLWAWNRGFVLPLPGPFPHLGTEQDMVDSVKQCKELGVNVVPFISVLQANPETAPRYGAKVTDNNGWTYHTEMVPRWNPPYATGYSCVQIGPLNKQWHDDVFEGCKHLIDIGVHSISWDQYWTTNDPEPNMNSLTSRIRAYAKQHDPESTFSGEELWNIEIDCNYLDYTWNWGGYRDLRPLTSVLPSPRVNACISSSPISVKQAFADNMYLNIFPRKKESVNGSDYINNYPDLSQALKQCAKLRKQFLTYFTDGTLIGECILAKPSPYHVSAYVLPDKVMMILLNQHTEAPVSFSVDVGQWLASKSGSYSVRAYDMDGKLLETTSIASGKWDTQTRKLANGEIVVFEFEEK